MSRLHFVILDGNSIGMTAAAAFHPPYGKPGSDRFHNKAGFPNGATMGMVDGLLAALRVVGEAYPDSTLFPVLLWDGKARWRYDLYPAYKPRPTDEGSLRMRAKFKQQLPVMRSLWHYAGVPQVIAVDEEADDVAGKLAPRLAAHGRVTLVSKDGDWVQAITEQIDCYVHGEHARFIRAADLPLLGGKFGYASTRVYVECKALAGDTSDGIDGVDKVGMATAAKLLAKFGSAQAFWDAVDSGAHTPNGVIETRLAAPETRALFVRNLQLMDWNCAPPLQDTTFLWVGPAQRGELTALLAEMELKKAAAQLDAYRPPLDYYATLGDPAHPLHGALADAACWELAAA